MEATAAIKEKTEKEIKPVFTKKMLEFCALLFENNLGLSQDWIKKIGPATDAKNIENILQEIECLINKVFVEAGYNLFQFVFETSLYDIMSQNDWGKIESLTRIFEEINIQKINLSKEEKHDRIRNYATEIISNGKPVSTWQAIADTLQLVTDALIALDGTIEAMEETGMKPEQIIKALRDVEEECNLDTPLQRVILVFPNKI